MADPNQGTAPVARTLLGVKCPGSPARVVVWDTEEISVGRAPESDIVVEDSDASRHHAVFRRTSTGHAIEDLRTPNGTRVNGEPVAAPRQLRVKDVVRIGEVEITFIETRRDPGSLGLEVSFASELKGFATEVAAANPEATTLGLTEVAGPFAVGSVGDFLPESAGRGAGPADAPAAPAPAPPPVADLDAELLEFMPAGVVVNPSDPLDASDAPSHAAGEAQGGAPAVSLTLEIEGLSPDLRRVFEGLRDKTIELPSLRVRIKG